MKHEIGGLLTPDGRHFLRGVGTPPRYSTYDASTGEEVKAYPQLRDVPPILSMSGNSKSLLCREGSNLKVFDVDSGKEISRWT